MDLRVELLSAMFYLLLASIFFSAPSAKARGPMGLDPTLRSGEQPEPLFIQESLYKKDEKKTLRQKASPSDPIKTKAQSDEKEALGPQIKIFVKKIRVEGNRSISNDQLNAVTRDYLGKYLGYQDLEEIRRKLTLCYIKKDYINSGAVLPDQKISNGQVTFKIIEGKLSAVEVRGNRWLRDSYYKSRIKLNAGPPVNVNTVEEGLQILQQHDLIRQLRAELKPGLKPGEGVLEMAVEENLPFHLKLAANNYQSPSVGAERGLMTLKWQSLTGVGDILDVTYGRSEGLDPLFDAGYLLPLSPLETELILRYRKNDFGVIEEPFQNLDIKSESEIIEVKLRQPIWQTPNQKVALGVIGERLYSKSTLLDIPFSFSSGSINGESFVTALRFSQEYLFQSRQQVIAANSRFSWGIDAFNATINDNGDPDGLFFAWLGQFQYTGLFTHLNLQPVLKADIQLANDPLLLLEQLSVGGRFSVRGYRENQMVRDNGVVASVETRVPLVQNRIWADYLKLVPFFDYGRAWNTELPASNSDEIYSVGIGLCWALTPVKAPVPVKTELEIFWGYALKEVNNGNYDDDLQDQGIHFQFTISAF